MNEPAVLSPALSGRYEIEREIGRGGMATVYLARDIKHKRRVAIKVLSPELGAVLGVERFLSEIRVTANLQHPNVLPLFDSGEAAGLLYYVMPFVDGESLRARLDRERQLPLDETIRIVAAIANALDYAHAHGVVHRDLKPENILLQSGQPIVADFGIALAVSNAGGARVTQSGISLGTPQYMSPEQAAGERNIDARSDVYALGAMTYEMLVGEPPHNGPTSQATIARIVIERPRSIRESRPSVPEHVDLAIMQALEKLPADRFATAKDFADALQGNVPIRATGASRQAVRRSRGALIAAAVMSVAAVVASVGWWHSTHAAPPVANRFVINVPPGVAVGGVGGGRQVAMSHDGQTVAFINSDLRPYVRRLDQLEPIGFLKVLAPGPELHLSSDGQWLAYWSRGLNVIPVGAGDTTADPTKLVTLPARGEIAAFSSDLIYLYHNEFFSVPRDGGTPRKLASMDTTRDFSWSRPLLLSDGKTIAFAANPRDPEHQADTQPRLAVLSLDGGTRTVFDVEATGVIGYVDGILVFTRPGRLLAAMFDLGARKVVGEPVELTSDRVTSPTRATVSDNGTLAYLADASRIARLEMWDASGKVTWAAPDNREYEDPAVSPDGKRIALTVLDGSDFDIWIYDVASGTSSRLTQTGGYRPAWTPDAKRIAFQGKDDQFLWMPADGSAAAEPIPGTAGLPAHFFFKTQISADGKYAILLRELRPGDSSRSAHGVVVPLAGGESTPILAGVDTPLDFDVSPDVRWIAYESRETGRHEVFIRSFPGGAAKLQLSTDGGDAPRWTDGGRKLVYHNDKVYREVSLDLSGAAPRVVRTDTLFQMRDRGEHPISSYAVAADGKHFVVTRLVGEATRLVVVPNWITEVRARLATR